MKFITLVIRKSGDTIPGKKECNFFIALPAGEIRMVEGAT